MLKKINQCDVYVGMWCIYMLQGVLYPSGIINQLLQLIMLLWAMIAVFRYLVQPVTRSPILKMTFILILMYTIYGTIHIMFDEGIIGQNTYYYLQSALNSLAPVFLFYDFAMNGKLTSDRIRIYLPILIITCILLYYKNERLELLNTNAEEVTNNAGYFFVPLIPFLFFYSKNPVLQCVFMGIILLYLFMGMKRGAILIGVLGTLILLYANIRNSSRKMKSVYLALSIIIVVGIYILFSYMMNNSVYFMTRLEQTMEGNTSGRDEIYGSLWDILILEPSPLKFYFGRGAESTLNVIGILAHQDWLEIFCNNGLLGVFILLFFFYTLGKNAWVSRDCFSRPMFYSFVTLFIVIFSKTLFSMSIQSLGVSESMLIGFFAYWASQQTDNFEIDSYEQKE